MAQLRHQAYRSFLTALSSATEETRRKVPLRSPHLGYRISNSGHTARCCCTWRASCRLHSTKPLTPCHPACKTFEKGRTAGCCCTWAPPCLPRLFVRFGVVDELGELGELGEKLSRCSWAAVGFCTLRRGALSRTTCWRPALVPHLASFCPAPWRSSPNAAHGHGAAPCFLPNFESAARSDQLQKRRSQLVRSSVHTACLAQTPHHVLPSAPASPSDRIRSGTPLTALQCLRPHWRKQQEKPAC